MCFSDAVRPPGRDVDPRRSHRKSRIATPTSSAVINCSRSPGDIAIGLGSGSAQMGDLALVPGADGEDRSLGVHAASKVQAKPAGGSRQLEWR